VDVQTLKREQARNSAEVAEAESQLANDGGESFGSCCRRPRMSRPKGVWILCVLGVVCPGRTQTESSCTETALELLVQVPWRRRP
jgi:hypothetical protein